MTDQEIIEWETKVRLRDEFAMAALTGLLVGQQYRPSDVIASDAYSFADAMLEAREEGL